MVSHIWRVALNRSIHHVYDYYIWLQTSRECLVVSTPRPQDTVVHVIPNYGLHTPCKRCVLYQITSVCWYHWYRCREVNAKKDCRLVDTLHTHTHTLTHTHTHTDTCVVLLAAVLRIIAYVESIVLATSLVPRLLLLPTPSPTPTLISGMCQCIACATTHSLTI